MKCLRGYRFADDGAVNDQSSQTVMRAKRGSVELH